jgi:hypothetical protein
VAVARRGVAKKLGPHLDAADAVAGDLDFFFPFLAEERNGRAVDEFVAAHGEWTLRGPRGRGKAPDEGCLPASGAVAAEPVSPASSEVLARYQELRSAQRTLNGALNKTLSRKAIEETARRLGLWEGGRIVFDDEDAVHLLNDVAIYDYYPGGGKNAVERFADRDADITEDERLVLDAMCRARFTLVEVEGLVPGVGVQVHDMLFGQRFLLADIALSETAPFGLALATRLITFDSFSMTSGVHRVFDGDLVRLVAGPFASTMGAKEPPESWSSRDRSALARLLLQLAVVEPEEARHMLASYAIAGLPKGDPRREEYARLRARWEEEREERA